jgi:hypothetical protein
VWTCLTSGRDSTGRARKRSELDYIPNQVRNHLPAHGFVLVLGNRERQLVSSCNGTPCLKRTTDSFLFSASRKSQDTISLAGSPGSAVQYLPRGTAKAFAGTRSVAQEPGKEDRGKLLVEAVRRAVPSVLMACFIRSIMYAAARHIQPLTKFASWYQFSKPEEMNSLPDFTCAYDPPQE